MRFKEYLDERQKNPKADVEKMSDKEIIGFFKKHKKKNFKGLSGDLFRILIDAMKNRNLTKQFALAEAEPAGVSVYRALLAKQLNVKVKDLEFIGKDASGYYYNVLDKKSKHYKSTRFIKRLKS